MNPTHKIIFRDFKRHYHKVRQATKNLSSNYSLNINFTENTLRTEFTSPDDDETIRFIVLMRRFLAPQDTLYFRNVWTSLKDVFSDEIAPDAIQRMEELIEKSTKGPFRITINNETLTAEKIFETIANGVYFRRDQDVQAYLQNLAQTPIMGPLLWHQFYDYTSNSFLVVSAIFDIIREIEQSEAYRAISAETTTNQPKCIYCMTTTGNFTSEEHIFPESLGNDELILPKGFVCDRCNNEILSHLDEALLNCPPIEMLQVQYVPYTKAGKFPKANLQNLSMERTGPLNITIRPKDKTGELKDIKELEGGLVSFSIEGRGRNFDPKLLGRSLYKIALGIVALSQGHDHACDPKFNAARDFIRFGNDFPNNLLIQTKIVPHPYGGASYLPQTEGTLFGIDIFGLTFLLNLEEQPVLELNEILVRENFEIFSLSTPQNE